MAVGDELHGDTIETTVLEPGKKVDKGPHKGKWKRELKFCNITGQPVTVLITDNPFWNKEGTNQWGMKLYTGDKDETGKYNKESATKQAKKNGKKYTLSSQAAGNNCVRITYYYDKEPSGFYTDVYEAAPNNSTKPKPLDGTSTAGATPPVRVGMLPDSPRVTYAAVIPLPYPVSVETVTEEPIDVVLDRVEGLPEQFELIGTLPPLGQPHRLDPGDRMSSAVIYFRQLAPIDAKPFSVAAFQKIVSPAEVSDWPERRLSFDIEVGQTALTTPQAEMDKRLENDLAGIIVKESFDDLQASVEEDVFDIKPLLILGAIILAAFAVAYLFGLVG